MAIWVACRHHADADADADVGLTSGSTKEWIEASPEVFAEALAALPEAFVEG